MQRFKGRLCAVASFLVTSLALAGAQPTDAQAFCGFYVSGAEGKLYNNATTVVMMREGTKTVLSMQNNYDGPPNDFAMVIPVPVVMQKENIKTLDQAVFDKVDKLASPRLVEYFEQDPCYEPDYRDYEVQKSMAQPTSVEEARSAPEAYGVTIKAKFDVGEYNVLILDASNSNGLETWLRKERYNIPDGASTVFKPYIQQGMYFFVAKVDIKKVKYEELGGKKQVVLSPLRFHYDSDNFSLPVRLGLLNADGPQDLLIHILARGVRYEVANYKNVAIPTNLIVDQSVREKFGEFYAALFDYTLEQAPGAVVTEYAWDASTCDPCPGPTLDQNDMLTFGQDVLEGVNLEGGSARITQPLTGGWVLTRLHARYTLKELKDDLVFRAAPGIIGGRGTPVGLEGKMNEEGISPSSYNNFQGRYIMLNPWQGEIKCNAPRRGVWGGRSPQAAQDTAFVPRGKLSLGTTLRDESLPTAQLLPDGPHKITMPKPIPARTRPTSCAHTPAREPAGAGLGLLGLVLGGLMWRRARKIAPQRT